jgi:hypothetical protein
MADTTDPLRDKVVELIQVLQSTTPFTSATSARALCHHLVTNGKLSALRDLAASYDPKKSDVYEDIRNNHYGFVKSANRVGAQITRQTWCILLICTGQSHSFGAVVAPEFGPLSH